MRLHLRGAPWFKNEEIVFNDGLVTIIGVRGSGKTALAEFLASAAQANDDAYGPASFLGKARGLLSDVEAQVEWRDGSSISASLVDEPESRDPRVRYLSQQFVERLCSGNDVGDRQDEPLQREIENVIFDAIPEEDRLLCSSFSELRRARTEGALDQEISERANITEITKQIAVQNELIRSLATIKAKVAEAERVSRSLEADLAKIPVKANEKTVKAQTEAGKRLAELRTEIAKEQKREQSLRDLFAESERRISSGNTEWQVLKFRYAGLLTDQQWEMLRLKTDAEATSTLQRLRSEAVARIEGLRSLGLPGKSDVDGLQRLEADFGRLTAALGLDKSNARKRLELERRLAPAKQAIASSKEEEARALAAADKRKELSKMRAECYERIFEALDSHAEALTLLYAPLQDKVVSDPRLHKLNFVVKRTVNLQDWAQRGERLFDLRSTPFGGIGELAKRAEQELLSAWESGTPSEIRQAMETFTAAVMLQPRAQGVSPVEVGDWLFSTSHVEVRYEVQYDHLSLNQLSPGTRGVVLLTLYLALDEWDQRPLIIDQPEENLDPRSVYEELVPFFRDAVRRRQIIMVTHNANLVVNSDSDQVIIAESERVDPQSLPNFTYSAGGLEDLSVREQVCRLLEGGAEAFERRRQRYRPSYLSSGRGAERITV